ncbi:MAG: ArsA family ATPase [Pseudobdellovibrionaceae bacterium]
MLLGHEIHFITGKGGVGKSTVAAAMALQLARSGRKTLLVELTEQSFFKDCFELTQITYQPQSISENLSVSSWKGNDCLKEYALYLLKSESLYKIFFENPIMQTFIRVAPTLQEIAILGKVTSQPRHHGPEMPFESIVVDGFATGHFLAMMRAPGGLAKTVQFGPMGEQSKGIDQCLRNSELCKYHIVTLPEELPLKETLDLSSSLYSEFQIQANVILNKMISIPESIQNNLNPNIDSQNINTSENIFTSYLQAQQFKQTQAIDFLEKNKMAFRQLPWIFKNSFKLVAKSLADFL